MAKLVTLKVGEGNWEQGFSIILQIAEEGKPTYTEVSGRLPGALDIPQNYDQWQLSYRHLPVVVRLTAPATQITNVSTTADCRQTLQTLQDSLNRWLNSESFRPPRERLLENLNRSEPIRFIIQTKDGYLRRLPWNLIEFFDHYPNAEVAIGSPIFQRVVSPPPSSRKLRILAILGNSEGIDITADRKFLENLPRAETVFLVEPPKREISEQLWEQHWDILFFAGHSHTEGEVGRIYLNQTESLTVGELKYGLRKAIERGLQLAIFNSCDGLGLAKELENLHIPQAIVMREPVPDKVAQEFLKHFLKAFSKGQSLYSSVRMARERLAEEGLDAELPGVLGLPIIVQNPAATPLVWPGQKKLPIIIHRGKLMIGALALASALLLIPIVQQQIPSDRVYDPTKEQLKSPIKTSYPKNWKIKYPQNWQATQGELIKGEVVQFVAPQDNPSEPSPASVMVNISPLDSSYTLKEYTDEAVNQISQQFTSDPITPITTQLAGLDAIKIFYTQQQGDRKLKIKKIWALKANHAYIITYQAESAKFTEYEKTAQKIIDSLTID